MNAKPSDELNGRTPEKKSVTGDVDRARSWSNEDLATIAVDLNNLAAWMERHVSQRVSQ